MAKTLKVFFISFTIVAFVLFSTFGTSTAYADGDDGTDTGTTETTTEEEQASDPATDETPTPAEEADPENVMDQVPDNTTVTVLSSEGEALPLASQETADAIASAYDPIWCPAGQVPTPSANGCTESFSSFDDLLSFLQANEGDTAYQQAGTIYIQQGAYLGGESSIDFNNYTFTQINNYDLTLQGGWDTSYDPDVDGAPTYTSTQFNVPITIGSGSNPWIGSLTINDLTINGVNNQTGLTLYSQNDINLENVEVTDSQSGAELNAGGDVSVKNSKFNNNGSGNVQDPIGKGLDILSGGNVSLSSIEANNNQLFGANILAVGDVIVTNGFFNSNQGYAYINGWVYDGYGLQVITTGAITLETVAANDNYLFGARLEGGTINVANSSFSENDSDWHEHSIGSGIQVVSTDRVTLSNVTANNNQQFGADIEAAGIVTVIDSFFNGNQSYIYNCDGDKVYYGYGIQIVTDNLASLENVEATGNNLFGAHIEAKDVAIDVANFSNNSSGDGLALTGRGLEIISQVDVALAGVTANNNQLFGANISAGDLVAIEQSSFNGHITYVYDYFSHEIASRDGGYGLRVVTGGNIAIEDVTADNNYLYGAYIEGNDVAIERGSFTGNGSGVITEPVGYGLKVVSTDDVSLFDIDASNNQIFGADIVAEDNVNIVRSFFSGHQTVSFTPCFDLEFHGYGLTVVTEGTIFLDYVEANYNNLWGASLTGDNVLISNSQFNNNVSDSNIFIDDTGLIVNASGFVDIYNTEAKENRLIGAVITAGGDVYIELSDFSDNRGYTCLFDWCPEGSIIYHGYGLSITTPGLIQVITTNANNNNLFGAQLNGGVISVSDSNFNNNGMGNGLTINASDNVTLTNVTAVDNGGNGVDVTGVCQKIVQVNGGTFTDNALYGLSVVNATLNMDGTQTFANNGSGNVFTDTSTCITITITSIPDNDSGTTIVLKKPNSNNSDKRSKVRRQTAITESVPVSPSVSSNTGQGGTTEVTQGTDTGLQIGMDLKTSKKQGLDKRSEGHRKHRRGIK
ncbi:MAG TPA: hypothetical protein DCX53_14215 [Anaerolineae bacterium]|nr:hypothetical protein [Anaerolineae bacterium]